MTRFDKALRASGVLLALSLSLAAIAVAWAMTTRTTPANGGTWPVVYRENLLTGEGAFCGVVQGGSVVCLPHRAPKQTNDFSDRATAAE